MMEAMPTIVWDLQAHPAPPPAARSLRWSFDWDSTYLGPLGQLFHHRIPSTDKMVFTFEISHLTFQCSLDTNDQHLNPGALRGIVKDMVYIH